MEYKIFENLKAMVTDILELMDRLENVTNQDDYNNIQRLIFDMERGFSEASRKAAGELSLAVYKSNVETEKEIREKIEGKYFQYNDEEIFQVIKVGKITYDIEKPYYPIWLNDCVLSGIWKPLSRTDQSIKIGTLLHKDIAYKPLKAITEEEFKAVRDKWIGIATGTIIPEIYFDR